MFAAVTDHVFIDGGHTLDFTNKAFEALDHLGADAAAEVLPTLVQQTAARAPRARSAARGAIRTTWSRSSREADARLAEALDAGAHRDGASIDVAGLAERLLGDDPSAVVDALLDAIETGATPEQLGRARRARRRAPHQPVPRAERLRRLGHRAPRVHRGQRPAPGPGAHAVARAAPRARPRRAADLPRPVPQRPRGPPARRHDRRPRRARRAAGTCRARSTGPAAIAAGYLRGGGDPRRLVAALGHALLAGGRRVPLVPGVRGRRPPVPGVARRVGGAALILAGLARFLAAHTPTRRELPTRRATSPPACAAAKPSTKNRPDRPALDDAEAGQIRFDDLRTA